MMKKLILWSMALFAFPMTLLAVEPEVTPPAPASYNIRKADQYEKLPPLTQNDIVFLGNSITDGCEWHELFPGLPIKNRGISGDRTWYVLDRLDNITGGRPAKVFLMIGVNDLGADFSPEFVASNLRTIMERFAAESPATKLYVQSILPVNDFRGPKPNHVNKDAEIVAANRMIKEICAEMGVEYLDIWSVLADENGKLRLEYTNDGLHLTGAAYLAWAEAIRPYVN